MGTYQTNRVPGRSYFFTVRLADPHSTLLTEHISAFGEALRQVRTKHPFHIDAWVVLHDHAHTIWTLPPGDHDCAARWRAVKIAFSKSVRKSGPSAAAIWQRRFQQHQIGGDDDYRRLVDYVHANPVSHGMCRRAHDWPWSSVHRFVAEGLLA
jgi:putative transposase